MTLLLENTDSSNCACAKNKTRNQWIVGHVIRKKQGKTNQFLKNISWFLLFREKQGFDADYWCTLQHPVAQHNSSKILCFQCSNIFLFASDQILWTVPVKCNFLGRLWGIHVDCQLQIKVSFSVWKGENWWIVQTIQC